MVYFGASCRRAIDDYLTERNKNILSDNRALFGSRDHNRISAAAVHRLVKKHLLAAGLDASQFLFAQLRNRQRQLNAYPSRWTVQIEFDGRSWGWTRRF